MDAMHNRVYNHRVNHTEGFSLQPNNIYIYIFHDFIGDDLFFKKHVLLICVYLLNICLSTSLVDDTNDEFVYTIG